MQHEAQQTMTEPTVADALVELELGDGSRLVLEEAVSSPIVHRIDADRVTLADAMSRDGSPFAGYRLLK